jgi:putative DNA-invertase from lambdoid prophage Rac
MGTMKKGPAERRHAALYLRVSTDEQTVDNQRPAIELLARTRGLSVAYVFQENASAAKRRPEFERMMDAARRGEFDVLVVWALDRFGRSMVGNMQAVLELDRLGIQVVSVREPWLDTGGAVRPLLVAIFSWVAEQERAQLVERTRAGMARARKQGVRIGRPEARIDVALALAMQAEGDSVRRIAQRLKVPKSTVQRALQRPKRGSAGEAA